MWCAVRVVLQEEAHAESEARERGPVDPVEPVALEPASEDLEHLVPVHVDGKGLDGELLAMAVRSHDVPRIREVEDPVREPATLVQEELLGREGPEGKLLRRPAADDALLEGLHRTEACVVLFLLVPVLDVLEVDGGQAREQARAVEGSFRLRVDHGPAEGHLRLCSDGVLAFAFLVRHGEEPVAGQRADLEERLETVLVEPLQDRELVVALLDQLATTCVGVAVAGLRLVEGDAEATLVVEIDAPVTRHLVAMLPREGVDSDVGEPLLPELALRGLRDRQAGDASCCLRRLVEGDDQQLAEHLLVDDRLVSEGEADVALHEEVVDLPLECIRNRHVVAFLPDDPGRAATIFLDPDLDLLGLEPAQRPGLGDRPLQLVGHRRALLGLHETSSNSPGLCKGGSLDGERLQGPANIQGNVEFVNGLHQHPVLRAGGLKRGIGEGCAR